MWRQAGAKLHILPYSVSNLRMRTEIFVSSYDPAASDEDIIFECISLFKSGCFSEILKSDLSLLFKNVDAEI